MQVIKPSDYGFWLLTQGSSVHLIQGRLPQGLASDFAFEGQNGMVIGELEQQPLWLLEERDDEREYTSLRELISLPERTINLLHRGVELNHFYKTHKFCGKCGSETEQTVDEWAVQCKNSDCGHRTYPVICPSIIVAVRRGEEILLACHVRHKETLMYTTLAGFVEVGESFEQTVQREVFEETAIKIKNLRYFGSQPWAFPNSQMVGFLADYDSGEIQIQKSEIFDAKWFKYNQPLPNLPPEGSIALKLIKATLALCAGQ
ncbi:NAD(+) diphosphatase [Pasteurellaceae bacterium LIM206]|nr:NAD(+) diphosphatase [Pasteurellaceae bacterium LIM206]